MKELRTGCGQNQSSDAAQQKCKVGGEALGLFSCPQAGVTQAGQCYLCAELGAGCLRSILLSLPFSMVWWQAARLSVPSLQPASFSDLMLVPWAK